MEDKLLKKYRFVTQVMIIFSIMVISVMVPGCFLDETAREYSTFYALAPDGVSFASLWQMLGASFGITLIQNIIFETRRFQKMMMLYKTILLLACILVLIITFVFLFRWFPIDMPMGWISFISTFALCFLISTVVMVSKTRRESQTYDRLLNEYKEKKEEGGNKE